MSVITSVSNEIFINMQLDKFFFQYLVALKTANKIHLLLFFNIVNFKLHFNLLSFFNTNLAYLTIGWKVRKQILRFIIRMKSNVNALFFVVTHFFVLFCFEQITIMIITDTETIVAVTTIITMITTAMKTIIMTIRPHQCQQLVLVDVSDQHNHRWVTFNETHYLTVIFFASPSPFYDLPILFVSC